MKTKTKMWSGTIILVIIVVVIVKLSLDYPPTSSTETSATIGKVEKYRKEQLSEKDIKLRTEFVKDSAVLIASIQALMNFNGFVHETGKNLETWWLPQLKKYYSTVKSEQSIKTLEDYSQFLKNNNQVLQNTISMLLEFYSGNTKEGSTDIEQRLIAFSNFVGQMAVQDSIFVATILDIDQFIMSKDPKGKSRSEEIKKLKDLRDFMIVNDVQYAAFTGDEKKIESYKSVQLYNLDNFNNIQKNIESIANYNLEQLKVIAWMDKEQLKYWITNQDQLKQFMGKEKLQSFIFGGKEQLKSAYNNVCDGLKNTYGLKGKEISAKINPGQLGFSQIGLSPQ